jgi:acetyltransferase
VLKADAVSVAHKTDMGGVALNLTDAAMLRTAVERMQQSILAPDLRFLVQKFIPGGLEVILGAKREEGLGHSVVFGLGGIFVEVLKDVVFCLTPISDAEAREMLASIKAADVLTGVRGQKGVDCDAIVEMIQRLSMLLGDLPMIREMDLNPVLAFADGLYVADARILIDTGESISGH